MTGHSFHHRKDNNGLVIYITMVNPSNILPTMFPFDDNKQTIVTRWIRELRCHPFWEKSFLRLVEMALDTKLSIYTVNRSGEFFSIKSPSSYDDSELYIQKSGIQQNVSFIKGVSRSAGTGKGVGIVVML